MEFTIQVDTSLEHTNLKSLLQDASTTVDVVIEWIQVSVSGYHFQLQNGQNDCFVVSTCGMSRILPNRYSWIGHFARLGFIVTAVFFSLNFFRFSVFSFHYAALDRCLFDCYNCLS